MTLRRINSTMHATAFGAAALMASQVAGKATRDAFFLSQFSVTALPLMVIAASLLSIGAGMLTAHLLTRGAAKRLLPYAFIGGASLLLIEWGVSTWSPALAALLIYLQMTVLGSVLISGFWSMLDDQCDARSARKQFGKIVAASTFGGVVGGLLAGQVGARMGVGAMLPILACLHLVCAFITSSRDAREKGAKSRPRISLKRQTGASLTVLRSAPYVRNLALLLVLSTMGAGLLDYVFKLRVSAAYPDGNELVRFFALFYTAISVGTFLLQFILSRATVEKLGIAGAVSSLPLSLAVGSVGSLIIPGLPAAAAMRSGEAMVRSSMFKSGYEMFYAAIPRRERHATKAILDIGVERLGDLLGAVLLGLIAWAVSPDSTVLMLVCAATLGVIGFLISRRLRLGYVQALENSLMSRSLSVIQLSDWPVLGGSVLRTILDLAGGQTPSPTSMTASVSIKPAQSRLIDPIVQRVQELRSSDADVVRSALRTPLDLTLVPSVVDLLAWDEVSEDAIDTLKGMGSRITGQLVDALLDPDQEFAVRRRIPRVLGEFDSQRATDGLIEGLWDARFEVRFHSGRALEQLRNRSPQLAISRETIMKVVQRELQVSPEVSRNYRVIDGTHQQPEGSLRMDHVFRLLSLIHAREPLQIAHRALMSGDDHLRQTSLEYLENILPFPVWQRILPLFEKGPAVAIPA